MIDCTSKLSPYPWVPHSMMLPSIEFRMKGTIVFFSITDSITDRRSRVPSFNWRNSSRGQCKPSQGLAKLWHWPRGYPHYSSVERICHSSHGHGGFRSLILRVLLRFSPAHNCRHRGVQSRHKDNSPTGRGTTQPPLHLHYGFNRDFFHQNCCKETSDPPTQSCHLHWRPAWERYLRFLRVHADRTDGLGRCLQVVAAALRDSLRGLWPVCTRARRRDRGEVCINGLDVSRAETTHPAGGEPSAVRVWQWRWQSWHICGE